MTYGIIIRGPLGIGKTTISKKLAKELNAEYIPYDRIVDNPDLIKKEEEQGYISQKTFFQANEIAAERAKKHLDKKPVIFDGNFYWRSQLDDLISRLDYPYYIFTLKAPLEECIKRDSNRKNRHGREAAEAVYKKSSFNYGEVIRTKNKNPGDVVLEIKKRLK